MVAKAAPPKLRVLEKRPPASSDDATELPVYGVPPPNRLRSIEMALRDLENGTFRTAALLWDAMLRDDRISGCLTTRLNGLFGAPLVFEPPDESARAARIVEDIEDLWPDMVPDAQAMALHSWGLGMGLGIARKSWATSDGSWVPSIETWHPTNVTWRWDTRSYWLSTEEGNLEIRADDQGWMIYAPHGYSRAYIHGLFRPLSMPWLERRWTSRDWARFSEVHGMPVRLAVVPADAKLSDKQKWLSQIKNLGFDSTLRASQSADGTGFDLKIVEAQARGYESFERHLAWRDRSIAIVLLGQAMSTEGVAGLGSQDKAGESVRDDLKIADAKSAGDLYYKHILRPFCEFEYGDANLAPYPRRQVEPPEDEGAGATTLKMLADALASFKASGAPIDVRATLGDYSVDLLTEAEVAAAEDEKAAKAAALAPPPPPPGSPPAPGSAPPGSPVVPPAPLAPSPAGRAALGALHPPPVSVAGGRGLRQKPGAKAGRAYADRLTASASQAAARALAPDVAELRAIVAATSSAGDLKERLARRFRRMRPDALAKIVGDARVLARMAGRLAIVDDL